MTEYDWLWLNKTEYYWLLPNMIEYDCILLNMAMTEYDWIWLNITEYDQTSPKLSHSWPVPSLFMILLCHGDYNLSYDHWAFFLYYHAVHIHPRFRYDTASHVSSGRSPMMLHNHTVDNYILVYHEKNRYGV